MTEARVRAAVRAPAPLPAGIETVTIPDLSAGVDWSGALRDVDVIVHLAARVHVMRDTERDPLAAFRNTNVNGTLALARAAARAGVRRFIYLSSIKVNGEGTDEGKPFRAQDPPNPLNPYAVSKLEAEQGLAEISVPGSMQYVIIRPPLVYGPGVRANFRSMMRWVQRGVPLPFGSIANRRSLVARPNLVDLIVTCLEHPAAANQTFLVADGEDLSTTELLRRIGRAMNHPARLLPIPPGLLKSLATLLGRRDVALRLCDSLQVDIAATQRLLGWHPPVSVDVALRETAEDFLHGAGG